MTASVHLSLAGRPGPSPHAHVVSGPNVKIAMARALLLRANASLPVIWEWAKRGVALVARTPGWVGHAVLGALSTPAGYSSTVQLVGIVVKAAWRLLDRAACLIGRGLATTTGLVASSVRRITPTWGQALISAHADAVDAANALHEQTRNGVTHLGQHLEQLAHNSLVKTVATRAAAAASGLLVLHVVTNGLLASKALTVAPQLAGLVIAATSAWWLLVGVTGATLGVIAGVAYLERGAAQKGEDLVVNIGADGSVTVVGLPITSSNRERERASAQATQEALTELTQGPTSRAASRRQRRTRRSERLSGGR